MNELISIVLPIYNGERYLKESIESIINQTYTNWELIVVDDCSTDSTPEIVKDYMNKDNRIRYYRNEKNLRLPRNLNKGFSLANGDYLTWTSDDNLFLPSALGELHNYLKEHPDCSFVFSSYNIIDEDSKVVSTIDVPDDYKDQIVGKNIVGACFLYTREVYNIIGDYQHGHIMVEDFDYWQRIIAKFNSGIIRKVLYNYRAHSASLTGKNDVTYTNRLFKETIMANIALYEKLSIIQKFNYYYGLYRCESSWGSKKYRFKYLMFKILAYPLFLRKKLNDKHK